MINIPVKLLMANKYLMFGISFVIWIGTYYLLLNTPTVEVFLNCVYITFGIPASLLTGWHFARIVGGDL